MTQFGKVYAETAARAATAEGLTAGGLRLFLWATQYFTDYERLDRTSIEAAAVRRWSEEKDLGPRGIQVVQLSYNGIADALGCHKNQSKRNIESLVAAGLLERISESRKGHGALYVVHPQRYTPACTESRSDGGKVHEMGDLGAHSQKIGTRADSLTCDDSPYSEGFSYSDTGGGGAESTPRPLGKCTVCHGNLEKTESGFVICPSCNTRR